MVLCAISCNWPDLKRYYEEVASGSRRRCTFVSQFCDDKHHCRITITMLTLFTERKKRLVLQDAFVSAPYSSRIPPESHKVYYLEEDVDLINKAVVKADTLFEVFCLLSTYYCES